MPLTALRSVAVDPARVPRGALLYIDSSLPGEAATLTGRAGEDAARASPAQEPASGPFPRLVLAQDTGAAIRGGVRADLFVGTGERAGRIAGRLQAPARLWLLWPKGEVPPVPAD